MSAYDEIEIEDMEWSESAQAFTYSCPCGDLFQITVVRMADSTSWCSCAGSSKLTRAW